MSKVTSKISPERLFLAAELAIGFGLLWAMSGDMSVGLIVASVLLIVIGFWISVIDFQRMEIPDPAVALLAALGIVTIWVTVPEALLTHAITACMSFAVFWGIGEVLWRRTGKEYLGIGDAKLFAAGGIWVGPMGLPSLLLVASATAILWVLAHRRESQGVAFGPFLALALVVVWLHGPIVV